MFDESTLNKVVHIAGDETTINEITQTLSSVKGKSFKQVNNGTNDDLSNLIETIKSADPSNVKAYMFYQYKKPMFNGVGKLENPVRKHYDGSSFTDFKTYISKQ